jgi:hypothetical protein
MKHAITAALAATATAVLAACSQAPQPAAPVDATPAAPARSTAPADARLYFIAPADGDTVTSPVHVVFGLAGMGIAPAGVAFENAGHHHLLIDTDLPADLSLPLPADASHVHFGKGQTEASVELAPGTHTLQLVLGDQAHIPFDPVVASPKITITVQ